MIFKVNFKEVELYLIAEGSTIMEFQRSISFFKIAVIHYLEKYNCALYKILLYEVQ